jgi:hypothetical protein
VKKGAGENLKIALLLLPEQYIFARIEKCKKLDTPPANVSL